MQLYIADDHFPRRENETDEEWQWGLLNFKAYLRQHPFEDHAAVEEWARAEFKKVRKKTISKLLRECFPNHNL